MQTKLESAMERKHTDPQQNANRVFMNHYDLVNKWLRYAKRRYPPLRHDPDLEAMICEVLWRAAIDYNKEKGAAFPTFAHYRVRGSLIDLVRKRCRARDSLDQPNAFKADPERLSSVPSCSDQRDNPERCADLNRRVCTVLVEARRRLDRVSRTILLQHCVEQKSLRSIAREMDYSYHQVRSRYQSALHILREALKGGD
jgi:RNA polymerase sigma factor (sigma-70 family)